MIEVSTIKSLKLTTCRNPRSRSADNRHSDQVHREAGDEQAGALRLAAWHGEPR